MEHGINRLAVMPGVYSGDLSSSPAARASRTELSPLPLNAVPMEKYAGHTEGSLKSQGHLYRFRESK